MKQKKYAFVVDKTGKRLSPTDINNAWRLIRTKKARCIKYNPMTIKLNKIVKEEELDQSVFEIGIDDGSSNVGFSVIQYCIKNNQMTRIKVIQKATMIQRQNVKYLMDVRRGYRKYHRAEKRNRACRFNNRAASKRKNRIAPTIKQKRDSVVRVVKAYQKLVNVTQISLEDVNIDIRVLTEGKKIRRKRLSKIK